MKETVKKMESMEFMSKLSGSETTSRLTDENIEYLKEEFKKHIIGDGTEIKKSDFRNVIKTKNQYFTDRVFDTFDEDKSGSISLEEFLEQMHKLAGDNADDKIQFLFKVYDADGNGLIQESELEQVMRANMEENGMKFSDEQIHDLTIALFSEADVDQGGTLTYDELKGQLEKYPGLLENLASSIERWLVPEKPKVKTRMSIFAYLKSIVPHQLSWHYIKNNYVFLFWLAVIFVVNIALFVSRVIVFHQNNPNATIWLVIARGCGQCLNFDCTLVAVTMLRQILTLLRSHGGANFLPIDQHIFIHKLVGWLIFIFGIVHTLTHLVNIELGFRKNPEINTEGYTYLQYLFDPSATNSNPKLGLIPGFAMNTGVLLYVFISIMVICSQPFIRSSGHFQVFFWTHLLYYATFVLLIIHAPNFWKWFLVPGILFFGGKFLAFFARRLGKGKSFIKSGTILPSTVVHLIIDRPPGFSYHPGDYVFVKIPEIAKFEWHPFTISSSPEQKGEIWLHIRGVGEWTKRLYDYFVNERDYQTKFSKGDAMIDISKENVASMELKGATGGDTTETETDYDTEAEMDQKEEKVNVDKKRSLEIFVEGPYGAPSSHIFRAEHAVLIGTGIGITPFASILQSIMRRYWMSKNVCPNCDHTWTGELPDSVLNLKKVDFFWINREQKSFEWFVQMLAELEMEQAVKGGVMERFLDMHMYITSALKKTDMKAVGLQLAMDLLYKKEQRDLITGLKTRTKAGRPDFKRIFEDIKNQNKGAVTVFFCGNPSMAKSLKLLCDDFEFTFRKECF